MSDYHIDLSLTDLAQARKQLADVKAERKAELDIIFEAYAALVERLEENLAILEEEVRAAGLSEYERTGVKQIHPAVTVKEYTTLDYDLTEAIDYCRAHLPKALKLDKRKFESAAKVVEPDFVTIGKEPRATIKRDLSAWLGE